nr:hypothetical protein [Alistipes communis]
MKTRLSVSMPSRFCPPIPTVQSCGGNTRRSYNKPSGRRFPARCRALRGNLQRFEPFDALAVFLDSFVDPQLNGGILYFKRWDVEIPIVGGDADSRTYIAAAAIDGKTLVNISWCGFD